MIEIEQKKKKVGSNKRYKIEEVKEIFKKGGCLLISDEYKNNSTKLKYICHCDTEKEISLAAFMEGNRCRDCSNKKLREERKLPISKVEEIFTENGCMLLSYEYDNNNTELRYMCPMGHEMTTSLVKFNLLDSNKCARCSNKEKHTIEAVRIIFAERDFILLDSEYTNASSPLLYQCTCGNASKMSLSNFRKGQNCHLCKGDKISKATKGKNNVFWDFELGEEERIKNRRIEGYNQWVLEVYVKDEFKCVLCGDEENGIHAHHLDGYHWCGERRIDPTNGVTLCVLHHRYFHSLYGNQNNTENQFDDYKYRFYSGEFNNLTIN